METVLNPLLCFRTCVDFMVPSAAASSPLKEREEEEDSSDVRGSPSSPLKEEEEGRSNNVRDTLATLLRTQDTPSLRRGGDGGRK